VDVHFHPAARTELDVLSARERRAIDHAVEKLQALGAELPFPHASHVEGTALFELRPRAGRGQWRAFYQQIGAMMVIAAIGPEAKVDARGFARAVKVAQQRLKALGGAE
jgi:hypothetical protein